MTNSAKRKLLVKDDQLHVEDEDRTAFKSDEITLTFADWEQWGIFSKKYADDNKVVLCYSSSKSVEWQNKRNSLKVGQPLLPAALRTYERIYTCKLQARSPSKEKVAKKPRLTACPFKLRVRFQYEEGKWLLKVTSSNQYKHNHSSRREPATVVVPAHQGVDTTPWISPQTASVMLAMKPMLVSYLRTWAPSARASADISGTRNDTVTLHEDPDLLSPSDPPLLTDLVPSDGFDTCPVEAYETSLEMDMLTSEYEPLLPDEWFAL